MTGETKQADKRLDRDGPPRPVVLCILDGWGYREETENNAFALAPTPNLDRLLATCPNALLETSGEFVGLPAGQMGNSEVGHMNIGGGRAVLQDLPRIDHAIEDGALEHNAALVSLIDKTKATGGVCHIMGLLSPGGVHSHQDHIVALATILNKAGVGVVLHAFLDGRDTPPRSALDFARNLVNRIAELPDTRLGTVCGRYYAMDRDKRWDRVERAWRCISLADAEGAASLCEAIENSYAADITDEFVEPRRLGDYQGMADGDSLIMANFRADRAREILTALLDPVFDAFDRPRLPQFAAAVGMVSYSAALDAYLPALFAPEYLANTLGEVVAKAGLHQLRIAETEKYAHVTFFFNGGIEDVFAGEERVLVPSPKVATYDLKPEMAAAEVTDRLVAEIASGSHDLIVCNYANPDMVGHTGVLPAAIKAMTAVDAAIGRVASAVETAGGVLLITADHGNLELMVDPDTGAPHTAHTIGKVPIILAAQDPALAIKDGALADIAPTILSLMDLPQPREMTGHSLIIPAGERASKRRETRASA